jgi:hypothetical protein
MMRQPCPVKSVPKGDLMEMKCEHRNRLDVAKKNVNAAAEK